MGLIVKPLTTLQHYFRENSRATSQLTEVFWDEVFTVVHDEDPSDIKLDVVLLFLVLKEVKGCTTRNKEQCSEFKLALNREVLEKVKCILHDCFTNFILFLHAGLDKHPLP